MSDAFLLAVEGLTVHVQQRCLLESISFALRAGETLTLVGESGAGKSLLAQAVMGNLDPALRAGGRVTLCGQTSRADDAAARRTRWGRQLALLPQEPALALDPLRHIGPQLSEVHALVQGRPAEEARAIAARELDSVGLGPAATRYPWQVSGGMAQRAAMAIAMAGGAQVLMVDEPTKGLDAHWCDHVITLLQSVQRAGGCVVTITHDLRVARALGGRVIVLREGRVVEQGEVSDVLEAPRHDFTRRLIAADPRHWAPRGAAPAGEVLLQATGLSKRFGAHKLFERLDLSVLRGERLVLQGPSGSGKSTLGNVLLGLMPPDTGTLQRAAGLDPQAFQKLYQDPVASFAPQVSLEQSLRDVVRLHRRRWQTVQALLDRLRVPESLLARRPASVSGGELQRVALARVLTVQPALVFADEPTSRLDPITQQDAMTVLLDAVDASGAALMLVTHDEGLAQSVGTRCIRLAAPPSGVDERD